jgi:hypothetical protein
MISEHWCMLNPTPGGASFIIYHLFVRIELADGGYSRCVNPDRSGRPNNDLSLPFYYKLLVVTRSR